MQQKQSKPEIVISEYEALLISEAIRTHKKNLGNKEYQKSLNKEGYKQNLILIDGTPDDVLKATAAQHVQWDKYRLIDSIEKSSASTMEGSLNTLLKLVPKLIMLGISEGDLALYRHQGDPRFTTVLKPTRPAIGIDQKHLEKLEALVKNFELTPSSYGPR